jgi:16S rRNA A1518/A1519 N6-dimethyltransferase RsmA/KsgA/DIM1 with predicted DNA glycosylase/AP lyase activity
MVLADDIGQVFINMQDKVDQVFDDFQLRKILPKIEIKPGLGLFTGWL